MSEIVNEHLWNQFNLADNNPDPGAGILYAIRFGTEDLLAHRSAVVKAICEKGAAIVDLVSLLGIDLSEVEEETEDQVTILAEELTAVNEAIEYHEVGISPDSINELTNCLRLSFIFGIASNKEEDKLNAFNLVDIAIPELVRDIENAQAQNQVLPESELESVRQLGEFASRYSSLYGTHRVVIIGLH